MMLAALVSTAEKHQAFQLWDPNLIYECVQDDRAEQSQLNQESCSSEMPPKRLAFHVKRLSKV